MAISAPLQNTDITRDENKRIGNENASSARNDTTHSDFGRDFENSKQTCSPLTFSEVRFPVS